MLISPAFAQSGGLAEGGFGLLPIIFVMVIFYFLLIRPQQKRAKQHQYQFIYPGQERPGEARPPPLYVPRRRGDV